MEVKLGIADITREITVETESSADEITVELRKALDTNSLFVISDAQGRQVIVPANRISYVELGSPNSRTVGFGAV